MTLRDWVSTFDDRRQDQNLPLDIWRKMKQIHDLRHPRLRDMREPSEFGLVGDDAFLQQYLNADR